MLLKEKQEIEKWLNNYDIKNYELIPDNNYGYVVNVNNYVNLSMKELESIDVKFNKVNGWFDCHSNKLKSLEGCPEVVNGYFDCENNELKSLQGCPEIVNGYFDCSRNNLKSLIGCPIQIGTIFNCCNNNLKSLDFLPEIINETFYCMNNYLELESIKKLINLKITDNYIDLEGNKKLGELQKVKDFNEIKKILNIYQEKADLMKVLEVTGLVRTIVTDKSVVESIYKSIENTDFIRSKIIKKL